MEASGNQIQPFVEKTMFKWEVVMGKWGTYALLTVLTLGAIRPAQAENFPSHTVTIVVPSAPGAGQDVTARLLAQKLSAKWGKSVIVENKPGAGTMIGAAYVVRSRADGHTILLAAATLVVNATLAKQMPFDPLADLTPVSLLARVPFVLVVQPKLPMTTVEDLVAYAKANPNAVTFGSAGIGTGHHLNGEMFQTFAGIKMTHVPYGGSSTALAALMNGEIGALFVDLSAAQEPIKTGKVRVLGVNTAKRLASDPTIPTIAESGFPGYDGQSWLGLFVPGATPAAAVAKLNADINEVVQNPDIDKQLRNFAFEPAGTESPDELKRFMALEMKRWAKVVTDAGVAHTQ